MLGAFTVLYKASKALKQMEEKTMEKFTPEIKAELIGDIARMKRMLDKISVQIESLSETACGLEFSPIIIDASRVMSEMEALKNVLKEWSDENHIYENVFGE